MGSRFPLRTLCHARIGVFFKNNEGAAEKAPSAFVYLMIGDRKYAGFAWNAFEQCAKANRWGVGFRRATPICRSKMVSDSNRCRGASLWPKNETGIRAKR